MNPTIKKHCSVHGLTDFRVSGNRNRCKKCSVDAVTKRRKLLKIKAVEYMGGVCSECKEEHLPCVFEFHHLNPKEKDFAISASGNTRSWDSIVTELEKCVMLCANCHRIAHYNMNNDF